LAGASIAAGCGRLPPSAPARARRLGYLAETNGAIAGAGTLDGLSAPGFLAFRDGLRDLGYDAGQNVELELRVADAGRNASYAERAAELVAARPDVLVASRTAPALALAQAARDAAQDAIPLVFIAVGSPVEIGLVQGLARPGRNVTGLASFRPDLASKRLELLKACAPSVMRPAILWSPANADDAVELAAMQAVAPHFGFALKPVEIQSANDVIPAVDALVRDGADAIIGLTVGFTTVAAMSRRLPLVYGRPDAAGLHGVLFAFGSDPTPMHRRAATYVDKILKGARASDLPVEQPTNLELVVNLQTAKALGLTIPDLVLSQATRIID
jgi:putative ABC transport system substrate-binding protein